jgi:D-glycero-D-manno-heptose 1,7-bisphosphate phosphatase
MQSDKRIVDGIGLWLENLTLWNWRGRSGLFLDRDGVLLEEVGFLGRPEDVRMIDGSADIVRWANNLAVPVIIVTNQSGIGRRYYNWQDFLSVQTELYRNLALVGAHIDLVAACAYHADAAPPYRVADHPWRKPNAGMIHAVAAESGLDLSCSALIGDR